MFDHVIVAIDGSPASFQAAQIGARLKAKGRAVLDLVCSYEAPPELTARLGLTSSSEEEQERCGDDLDSARAALGSQVTVRERAILRGTPAHSILRFAEEAGADLVCVGSGRHQLRLGSVSAAVTRRASTSVVVVPAGVSSGPGIRHILLGYDGSEPARVAASRAGAIAAALGAKLNIVIARPGEGTPPAEEGSTDDEDEAMLADARRLAQQAGAETVESSTTYGEPPQVLLDQAEALQVDLIVVGASGRSGKRRLGSTSHRLAARSDRPVLVVR